MTEDEARERVTGVDALGLDLSEVDRTVLANFKPLSSAAMALGVPLIVVHIDAESLAGLIGAGIDADVVVVTSLGPGRYRVRSYGGGDADDAFFESADGDVAAAQWSADPVTLVVDEIDEALRHGASRDLQAAPSPSYAPTNDYVYYDFDAAEESFSPRRGTARRPAATTRSRRRSPSRPTTPASRSTRTRPPPPTTTQPTPRRPAGPSAARRATRRSDTARATRPRPR
jgi:hypothetical protein